MSRCCWCIVIGKTNAFAQLQLCRYVSHKRDMIDGAVQMELKALFHVLQDHFLKKQCVCVRPCAWSYVPPSKIQSISFSQVHEEGSWHGTVAQTDIPYSQHAAHPAHHTRQPETKRRQRSTHFEYLRTSFFLSCNLCTLKLCSSFQSRLFDLAWEVCVIWLRCLSLSAQCKQHNWDLWLQLKRNLLSSSVHFPRLSYLLPPLLNLGVVGKVFDCMLACFHETATDFPHHLFALLGFKFGRTKLRLWHRASCKSQAGRHLQTKLGAAEPGPKSRLSVHSL